MATIFNYKKFIEDEYFLATIFNYKNCIQDECLRTFKNYVTQKF